MNSGSSSHGDVPSDRPPSRADRSVLDWAREAGEADRLVADLGAYLRRRRQRQRRAAVAAVAVLIAGGIARPWRWAATRAPAEVMVQQPSRQTLADGTRVELASGAKIDVAFSASRRVVRLQRGAAHFAVVHDASRPFVVAAGGVEAHAVGTAFAVAVGSETIDVLVTEGRVAVNHVVPAPEKPNALAVIDAGRGVAVRLPSSSAQGAAAEVTPITGDELRRRLDWRVPRLEFSATPLSRVVTMFNEHAAFGDGTRLELGDQAIGPVQISGVLRADDIESLVRLLEGEFKITAERRGDVLVFSRR